MRQALPILALLPLLAAAGPAAQRTVADAQNDAAAAEERSEALRVKAEEAERAVRGTAARRKALERDIAAQEARIAEARAALAIIGGRLAEEERALAIARAPLMRLTGALERFSRQPPAFALLRPGSTKDLVHVRAILDSTVPRIEARTAETRVAIRRVEKLRAAERAELDDLAGARAALAERRQALAEAEVAERRALAALQSGAVRERSRALALGEEARDIVANEQRDRAAGEVLAVLQDLPPPPVKPRGDTAERSSAAYRLPVAGKVVNGFGEESASGYRQRGITIAAEPGAAVVAPAAGTVRYAGRYRSFGDIVIIDHGAGWTSLVTGLGRLSVAKDTVVRAGEPLGSADRPVTLELRRKGKPVDVAAML